MSELLNLPSAATKLGCSVSILQKKCKLGEIPSIKVGRTYRILQSDLEAWTRHSPQASTKVLKPTQQADLLAEIEAWLSYLSSVKALSKETIRTHRGHLFCYLKRMGTIGHQALTVQGLFERKTLLAVFALIPAKSYAVKYNTDNALLSLGQFLIEEGKLSKEFVDEVRLLKPRRQSEARRTHLRPLDIPKLFEVALTRSNSPYENVTVAAMLGCMVYGGLRVSEVCGLRPQDIDLASRVLTVRHGKGGKDRRVGISTALYSYLEPYSKVRPQGTTYFLQAHGVSWHTLMLSKRMRTISERLGVDITCHGLRRTFATLAANQGRSINSIRIALGHSNLETTQAYLRTSEAEVVEQMKDW